MRFSQAGILEWVAISSARRSPWPREQTHVSCSPLRWQVDSLPQFISFIFKKFKHFFVVEVELIYSVQHGNFNVAFITGLMPDFVSISWWCARAWLWRNSWEMSDASRGDMSLTGFTSGMHKWVIQTPCHTVHIFIVSAWNSCMSCPVAWALCPWSPAWRRRHSLFSLCSLYWAIAALTVLW